MPFWFLPKWLKKKKKKIHKNFGLLVFLRFMYCLCVNFNPFYHCTYFKPNKIVSTMYKYWIKNWKVCYWKTASIYVKKSQDLWLKSKMHKVLWISKWATKTASLPIFVYLLRVRFWPGQKRPLCPYVWSLNFAFLFASQPLHIS